MRSSSIYQESFLSFFAKALFVTLTILFLWIFTAALQGSQVLAQEIPPEGVIIFEDDFSQGFEKWQLVAGNWNMWQIVGEDELAQALVETSSTITQIAPKDEFWPEKIVSKYEYRLLYQPIEGYDRNIGFGFLDNGNWCEIHFVSTFYQMICKNAGALTLNVTKNFVLQNGPQYQIVIRFEEGRIRIWIDGVLLQDVIDIGYNGRSGKPLLRAGTGALTPTKVRFDSIQVFDLDPSPVVSPTPLPVPPLSQLDPAWVENEYDTASEWATDPSLGRWGCALTSMTMILQYYGLDTFPAVYDFLQDGSVVKLGDDAARQNTPENLTPATLNAWLKFQPDGYIGQGLLNWWAVTRLTREISQGTGDGNVLPKLEYFRVPVNSVDPNEPGYNENQVFYDSLQTSATEIAAERPVIVEIPGHFVVANGNERVENSSQTTDLTILDPFYGYELFSQHRTEETPLPLLSTRTFTPSFTDLSAIVIVHDPALVVELFDGNDQLTEAQTFVEQIIDQNDPNPGDLPGSTPLKMITQLTKPETGMYSLKISSLEPGFYDFAIYAYDQEANPSIFSSSEWFGGASASENFIFRTYSLEYVKNASSQLKKITTWETFLQDLNSLLAAKEILSWYVWDEMTLLATYAHEFLSGTPAPDLAMAQTAQERYAGFLRSLLNWYQEYFSGLAKNYLDSELQSLTPFLVE